MQHNKDCINHNYQDMNFIMSLFRNCQLSLMCLLLLCALSLQAKDACNLRPLMHQRRDVATIQHLEDEWSLAYLRGNTGLERCLLAPDFTEILRTGEVKILADELELAAKNRGKNLTIPSLPKPNVLLHGNVAVAYGLSSSSASDGQSRKTRYADYYLWENGAWHAYFAQQTQIKNNPNTSIP
jgi:hypothetical protein